MGQTRKTILITGASSGIGAATALAAARSGYDVGLGYLSDEPSALALAQKIRAVGARAELLQGDIADPEAVDSIFSNFDDVFDELNVLVNNAGIVATSQRVEEMSYSRVTRMFATNAVGPFLCAQHAVLRMAYRYGGRGGVILNVSSRAAKLGSAGQYVDYAASKGALDVLTKGLAKEVAPEGIRVVGVRPGVIDTGLHAKGGEPDRAESLKGQIPMGRVGTADEVARTLMWLMSDRASYVTGTTVDVGGGR